MIVASAVAAVILAGVLLIYGIRRKQLRAERRIALRARHHAEQKAWDEKVGDRYAKASR
jgi:hypothetical protein